MLYVSNNGETCRDVLCQHPECWQSNIRRVREAVRQRNGIEQDEQYVNKQSEEKFEERKRKTLEEIDRFSLPTLKIIDMTEDLGTPPNYNRGHKFHVSDNRTDVEKNKCLQSSMARHSARPPCQSSFRTQVPHTTPISPSLPEKHQYKENSVEDGKMTKINFHEIYDYDEVCREWQDLFISTAYLVWCPSKKRRRKKEPIRASSAVAENRTGFKNFVEDLLPLPPESGKKKHWPSSKVPTGGQPYSPCRSPVSRIYNDRTGDYLADGEFIMTITTEDVPKSLITSKKIIIQKPNTARKYEELKKSSSTKVLVDIAASLPTPAVAENNCKVQDEGKIAAERAQLTKRVKQEKRKTRFMKATSDIEPRKMLPLPSIAIPWGVIPDRRRGHCRNSIPHSADLDVMMEPVLYLPRTGSTVSGVRSRVCASADVKGKPLKSEVKTGPSKESLEERHHLTSAYRFSPKKVGTPAPTPATPRTRDEQRRRLASSGRKNTKESLSKTRLEELSEARQTGHALDGAGYKQVSTVQSTRAQIDQAINDVAKSNRGSVESIGNELSRMFISRINADANGNTEAQSGGLNKVPGSESAMSDRAVSPSSRTNIPSDIWAELRCGGGYDHRRITPRSNTDVRHSDRSKSLQRSYHSSLGLSIYSYMGESTWKPHPPRLPKSFTYMGMFKPTVLPKMPAALTVVPVPSVSRTSLVDESRSISHLRSIRIPPVPRGSPVPNNGVATASTASLVPETSTEAFGKTEGRFEEQQSLKSSKQKVEKTNISHEVEQEQEYLISREIIQEIEELPLHSEDQTARTIQIDVPGGSNYLSNSCTNTFTEETLQDLANSDKYIIEDTLHVLEALTNDDDEFTEAASKLTCTESAVTCPKPQAASTSKITLTKDEITNTSVVGTRSNDELITRSVDEITCERDEITWKKDETTCSEDKITRSKGGMSYSLSRVTDEVVRKDDNTCTNDEVTCSVKDSTRAKKEITRGSREDSVVARDIHITTEEPESGAKSVSGVQSNQENSNNNDGLLASPISSPVEKPSFKSPTREIQGSYRSLLHAGEDVKSILSECNFLQKVPSNFELMPLNVESDLLLPIKIESDLLLLNEDSLIDLTPGEDLERTAGRSKVDNDEIAVIDLTKVDDDLAGAS